MERLFDLSGKAIATYRPDTGWTYDKNGIHSAHQGRASEKALASTALYFKPASDYPVASASPNRLWLRSLAPRICSYSVDLRPVPRPKRV